MPQRQLGQSQEIPFADFSPDLDPTTPGIILDAHEAIPTVKGFSSRNAPVTYAPALPETPLGAYVALYVNGTTSVLAATRQHIYRLIAGVWTVADTTGPFVATHPWVFTQFADDVIAVNPDVATPLVANGSAGTFAALTGSPPSNPVTAISVAGFAAMYVNNQWFNSSAGTDTGWTPNVQTQSASGFLYDYPGNIVAAAPFFRNQIVWKENAMWLLSYIGGTQVWSSELISIGTGTWSQSCITASPEAIYFLGTDDFYQCQGYAPQRIPNNFKEWFFDHVPKDSFGNPTHLDNTQSWYDPINAVVYWHYVSTTAPFAGVPDQYLAWNPRAGRWSHGYLNTPLVVGNTQIGVDAGLFFDTANVLKTWTGTPGVMSLLTGYYGNASNLTQLTKVRGKYEIYPTSQNFTPLGVYALGQADTAGTPGVLATDGWINVRISNRYLRGLLATVGPCEIAGLAFESRTAGVR